MIHGHNPAGYFETATEQGQRVEGETRQCCHCQFIWEYKPGSGIRRGWCLKHNGFLCGREECFRDQERLINLYLISTGKVVSCLAWEEWNDFLADRQAQLKGEFHFSDAGLIVPGSRGN
jgi:hypothetical protein